MPCATGPPPGGARETIKPKSVALCTVAVSHSSGATSSKALHSEPRSCCSSIMLKESLPSSFTPTTQTVTPCPGCTTDSMSSQNASVTRDMCTSPGLSAPTSTKHPNSHTRVTIPLNFCPTTKSPIIIRFTMSPCGRLGSSVACRANKERVAKTLTGARPARSPDVPLRRGTKVACALLALRTRLGSTLQAKMRAATSAPMPLARTLC
mmetsp:Transcript_8409/g.18344  ORF Transcript_8409/g.18344 Transcript_8409/m.18344 type:complete len:208 (+) Transcript_8409:571-1194(+)